MCRKTSMFYGLMSDIQFDIAIIGSGMAGLSAAIYAGRYEMRTVIIGDEPGGATASAWTIENYPGYKEIDGYDLIMKVKDQAESLGAKVLHDKVISVDKTGETFSLGTESGQTVAAKTLLFAHGAARRKLKLPKEDDFALGKGVHYCTTCDGPLYKGKTIGIVGGGDAAIKGANLAVQYAEKIHIIEITNSLKPEPVNMARLQPFINSGKVEVHLETEIVELLGNDRLTGVRTKEGKEFVLDGLFVEIGAVPEMALATKLDVKLDDYGYIAVNNEMETNIPGIYAAGDSTNFFGHFKQDITAAAMGAVAATSAFNYLQKPKD